MKIHGDHSRCECDPWDPTTECVQCAKERASELWNRQHPCAKPLLTIAILVGMPTLLYGTLYLLSTR